jgi:hypothetical protein
MDEENPPDLRAADKLRTAYRQANRLIVGAGLTLAAAGVKKDAPELKALRLALRAVNVAGGIEPSKSEVPAEAVKEIPHGYRFGSGPRSGGPGKVA